MQYSERGIKVQNVEGTINTVTSRASERGNQICPSQAHGHAYAKNRVNISRK